MRKAWIPSRCIKEAGINTDIYDQIEKDGTKNFVGKELYLVRDIVLV